MSQSQLYHVISDPEILPQLFDHILSVKPLNTHKSHYLETTRSLAGKLQKINLWIDRTPPERVRMTSDHWLLEMSMDIHISTSSDGTCQIRWLVLSKKFGRYPAIFLRFFFELWYLPKIKTAQHRIDHLAQKVI
jgi:hypothetical protein